MLGQLSHDAEPIEAIASGSAEPIGYAAVWLAAVMRFVGQRHIG